MSNKDIIPMSLAITAFSGVKLSNILVSTCKEADHLNSISIPRNVLFMQRATQFFTQLWHYELTVMHLQETYSLSVLMYAIPELKLTTRQVDELNACWNSVIRRLFGYNKWESVSAVLLGLGKLNLNHLILLRKVNFYRRLLKSCDTFLCDVFLTFLSDVCNDDVLMPVFCSESDVNNNVWLSFKNYVNR